MQMQAAAPERATRNRMRSKGAAAVGQNAELTAERKALIARLNEINREARKNKQAIDLAQYGVCEGATVMILGQVGTVKKVQKLSVTVHFPHENKEMKVRHKDCRIVNLNMAA